MSRSTVTRVIRAERNPTAQTLKEMAPVLGLQVGELVAGTDAVARVEAADQLVARSDYEAAVNQVIEFERQTRDLQEQVQTIAEERDNAIEEARRIRDGCNAELKTMRQQTNNALKREKAAKRSARHHEENAGRYRDALGKAVADVAQLRLVLTKLESNVNATRATGRVGAILAGVAAAVSVASYLSNNDSEHDDEDYDDE